ncbi:MAG: branched-chain amino acid aminotransferase [Pelagibacterales bacterium]|nr:branched-chain amino acid aminotransferase [Pelagibacterales bacterium]
MEIIKSNTTKINDVEFKKLGFGKTFTDHMFLCEFKDGRWNSPKIIPYADFSISPSSSIFHYGQAVFEGMKAYKDIDDNVWLFRPEENYNRLNKSLKRMTMPEIEKELFFNGIKELLTIDKEWIGRGDTTLYIRPVVFATEPTIVASPSKEYKFYILCSPGSAYYFNPLSVLIEDKYIRAAKGGVGYAKAAGNYAGSFYPTSLAIKKGFDQIVWTDSVNHKFIEEAGTMNIFFRINDRLITPKHTDTILDGVTRKSVITVAKDSGIDVEERNIEVSEVIHEFENGNLIEIFGAGTAAIIAPIISFGYKEKIYTLNSIKNSYGPLIKKKITDIQNNLSEDNYNWRYQII